MRSLLIAAGKEALSAAAEQEILSYGAQAIPPLIALLEDRELWMTDAPGQGHAPIVASNLLAELGAEQAIEPMLRALQDSEPMDVIYSELLRDLERLGEPAFAPALAAYERATDGEYRSSLCSVLAKAGVKDDRVLAILVEQLAKEPVLGAANLAEYGDPRAIPHLSQALDDYEVSDDDSPFANQAVIELNAAIEELGGELSATQKKKLRQAVRPRDDWRGKMLGALDGHADRELNSKQPRRKLGRNERCWCGSGKKYKKCHLASDEEQKRKQ